MIYFMFELFDHDVRIGGADPLLDQARNNFFKINREGVRVWLLSL
jgi:hypothetical protein